MSQGERTQKSHSIKLFPYDTGWPLIFAQEAREIEENLQGELVALYHIGSTSVPGLDAKRDIDILLVLTDIEQARTLSCIGYHFSGELNIPLRYFLSKKTENHSYNLHVCAPNHPFIHLNFSFRDRLRSCEKVRMAYQNLKHSLAKEADSGEKVRSFLSKYTRGKNSFIREILRDIGYQGTMLTFCLHDEEWQRAQVLRAAFFQKLGLSDSYICDFDDKNHKHIMLYQGCVIVAYAHIAMTDEEEACLQVMSVCEKEGNPGDEKTLLTMISTWLGFHHKKRLFVYSWMKAQHMAHTLGYDYHALGFYLEHRPCSTDAQKRRWLTDILADPLLHPKEQG